MKSDASTCDGSASSTPEWLPRLAHDLRGPLAPLRLAAQVLEGPGAATRELHELGKTVERQTQLLTQLADDLDDVLRISHGCFEMQRTDCELRMLVHEAVEQVTARARLLNIERRPFVVYATDDSLFVKADGRRLSQLIALMLNAIAPGVSNGGRCWVGCERADGHAIVRVHDDERRIWRSAAVDYLTTGEPPMDPGTLGMAPVIGHAIAQAHAAAIALDDEADGRIGELVLRMAVATH